MKKRLLSLLLVMSMVLTLIPAGVYADTTVTTWAELADAVAAAPTDDTVTAIEIGTSFYADSQIDIPAGANIVILSAAGGPYTITRDSGYDHSLFGVNAGAKLTLNNITLDGNAENVTALFEMVYMWGGDFVMDDGSTLQNIKADSGGGAAGVFVGDGTMVMMTGATIRNVENNDLDYGAVAVLGTFIMMGGTITDCKAGRGAGVAVLNTGRFNMGGGAIKNNLSDYGGVYIDGYTLLTGPIDISGNKKADGHSDCNVFLEPSKVVTVGALANTTPIGITLRWEDYSDFPVDITTAKNQDWSSKFISDNSGYILQNSGSGSSQVVQAVQAASTTIDVGDSSGTNLPTGVSYAGNLFTIDSGANDSTITVIGTTTANTIAVETDVTGLTLLLNGVSITSAPGGVSPMDLQGDASVTVQMADGTTNILDSSSVSDYAGLNAPVGATLTVQGGTGSLTAIAGENGAGIGGGALQAGGTLNFNGGTVTATGGNNGAGIGGGYAGDGGNITINGGMVTATGGIDGAGIGGGSPGGGGVVTINGGTVSATGRGHGAGIGGSGYGSSGTIRIDDAAVVAATSPGGKPAIDADASSSGTIINAQIPGSYTSELPMYLKYHGSVLTCAPGYKSFAFSEEGASSISAYSDAGCTETLGKIITASDHSTSIPTDDLTDGSTVTDVKIFAHYLFIYKDDSLWTDTPNVIKLSMDSASLTGAIAGTPVDDFLLFAGMDPMPYWVWDATRNKYTGVSCEIGAGRIYLDYYTLTVAGGGNGSAANGTYLSGESVSIDAGTKNGYTFSGWTSSNGGAFGNAGSASTTFTMPENAATITANWTQNSGGGQGGHGGGGSSGGGGGSSETKPNSNIIIDGATYPIGDEQEAGAGTMVTVDPQKVTGGIAAASNHSDMIIPVSENTNVSAQLVVKNIEDMAKKDMTLTVQAGKISYHINTSAVDTANITALLGMTDTNKIPFQVSIANSQAVVNGATMVVSPVEFTITATYNGKTVSVDSFSSFVDRTIEITAEQAKKITTAVVVEPNGSSRHVPTKVTVKDGKYYAVINSLTNSIYTVIWNPVEFSDVTAHWAKDAINDMGSRMVISGVGQGSFEPDRDITRAEFAAIMIRALGLAPGDGISSFSDVSSEDWYCGYVKTAAAQGIITGYDAATFGPHDRITREQAMTMIARAMRLTGLKPDLDDREVMTSIAQYADGAVAAAYAQTGVAACLKTGVVTGRSNDTIAPKDCITRAEVAVIIRRLLQKSDLI